MKCWVVGIGAGSWSAAIMLAVVGTINRAAHFEVVPWMLVMCSIGITAVIAAMMERSREMVLAVVHAEFEGEVGERHLSAI